MRRCVFLTMDSLEGYVSDDELTYEPLARLGWQVQAVSWRSTDINWQAYDAVVIRTTWDYQQDPSSFLETLNRIVAAGVPLENRLELVRWNIDKTYLRELEQQGLCIVPTRWMERFQRETIEDCWRAWGNPQLIIKPTISANADDTFWLSYPTSEAVWKSIEHTFCRRPLMVQPFLPAVLEEGEYSLFFFGGEYSHAILKTPKSGDFRVQEEHGGLIRPIQPSPALLRVAQQVHEALQPSSLYARIDLVRLPAREFALMEVELIEPSLYFRTDAQSAYRFAKAVDAHFR